MGPAVLLVSVSGQESNTSGQQQPQQLMLAFVLLPAMCTAYPKALLLDSPYVQVSIDRSEQRRHALAAAAKDRKLAQLRQAIQALEAKLLHLMQARAQQYASYCVTMLLLLLTVPAVAVAAANCF